MGITGLVPMGGMATRWSPLSIPKELLPVALRDGKPVVALDCVIDAMVATAADRILVPIRPEKAGPVMQYLGASRNGVPILYLPCATETMLATIQSCGEILSGDTVLFGMPDTYISNQQIFDLCLLQLEDLECEVSLGCFIADSNSDLDAVESCNDRLVAVHPKPHSRPPAEPFWGVAVWTSAFTNSLSHSSRDTSTRLGDLFNEAARSGSASFYLDETARYVDLGTPTRYFDAISHNS